MVGVYSFSHFDFFHSLSCCLIYYCIVYNCFPLAAYVVQFPFLILSFIRSGLPIHSISLFPSAFSTLSFVFLFPSPSSSSQFLAPLSPILPLKSHPASKHSSLSFFIVFSPRRLVILISLLYTVIIFHHSLPI
jgi:hypothetical protein